MSEMKKIPDLPAKDLGPFKCDGIHDIVNINPMARDVFKKDGSIEAVAVCLQNQICAMRANQASDFKPLSDALIAPILEIWAKRISVLRECSLLIVRNKKLKQELWAMADAFEQAAMELRAVNGEKQEDVEKS